METNMMGVVVEVGEGLVAGAGSPINLPVI